MKENNKITNIIFLIIFGIFLIIPICKFDNKKISESENRVLTARPKIFKVNNTKNLKPKTILKNINPNYFVELDLYINDRFFMREKLADLYKNVLYYCAIKYPHINDRFVDKKTKQIGRSYLPDILQNSMSKEHYKRFTKNINNSLVRFKKYCEKNNIKIYFLILPDKVSVYPPRNVLYNSDQDVKELIKDIDPTNELNILFPFDQLKSEVKGNIPIYYKTDHHLTNDGYYLVYKLLMHEIKKSFPLTKVVNKSEYLTSKNNLVKIGLFMPYENGSLYYLSGLTDRQCNEFLNYKYTYYDHKNAKDLKFEDINQKYLLIQKFQYNDAPDHKVLLIGDSNIHGMSLFLVHSFKSFSNIRLNGPVAIHGNRIEEFKVLKYYRNIIEKLKPDIIILCIEYSFVQYLTQLNKY